MTCSFRTERLLLRTARPEDADDIYVNIADWDIVSMLARPPWPYPRELADEYVKTTTAFMLEYNGNVIGACGISKRDIGHMLGFWIGKAHWGQGLMTEAAEKLTAAFFTEPEHTELHSSYLLDNPRSWRVQEKVGFRPKHEVMFFINSRQSEQRGMLTVLTRQEFQASRDPQARQS